MSEQREGKRDASAVPAVDSGAAALVVSQGTSGQEQHREYEKPKIVRVRRVLAAGGHSV